MRALLSSRSLTGIGPLYLFLLSIGCGASDALEPSAVQEPEVVVHNVLYDNKLEDINPSRTIVEVELEAAWSDIDVGTGEPLRMMTYNGVFPGPLLEANVGDLVIVHMKNSLDEPTTVHWHGLRIPDVMDGTPRVQIPIQPGETFTYTFQVPDAGSFWYHPHIRSDIQIERGLYGPIIVRDPNEPKVDAERIVIVDDILLNESGDDLEPFSALRFGMHGRMGNLLLSNGRADSAAIEHAPVALGTVERWRIFNTSNARTFVLTVDGTADAKVVGTDGGAVEPYALDWLLVPIGQRYDVLVTHGVYNEAQVTAHLPALDENNEVVQVPVPLYRVGIDRELESVANRVVWPEVDLSEFSERAIDESVEISLAGYATDTGISWTVNNLENPMEPIFTFKKGDTVEITLKNETGPEHPFHLHGQFFEIVDDGRYFTSQPGLKDTVLVPGNTELKIRAYFDNPGHWMAHCHILEHAALGMMSEILVLP